MEQLAGVAVLIEFWDFCRANSLRTLPYVVNWHERYHERGLQVIGVHAAGFELSRDLEAVQAAVARLGVPYPVVVDTELEIWSRYGNLGWPALYLFDQRGMLFEQHYGEGAYDESERAIQELLDLEEPLCAPIRPEDAPGALLEPQSEEVQGPLEGDYSCPYRAGGVWAVLEGRGSVTVNRRVLEVSHPGAYELLSHPCSTTGTLELRMSTGVRCHAICFTPGLAPAPPLASMGDPRRAD